MGPTKKSDGQPGFEINFWALPFYSGSTKTVTIFKACNSIEITYGYNNMVTSDTYIGFGIIQGKFSGFSRVKTLS